MRHNQPNSCYRPGFLCCCKILLRLVIQSHPRPVPVHIFRDHTHACYLASILLSASQQHDRAAGHVGQVDEKRRQEKARRVAKILFISLRLTLGLYWNFRSARRLTQILGFHFQCSHGRKQASEVLKWGKLAKPKRYCLIADQIDALCAGAV